MIIIIPIGGNGLRFKKNNYSYPKALIEVNDNPILFHLLDNLNLQKIDCIYITYNKVYKNYDFEDLISEKYTNYNFKFMCLIEDTKGTAETVYLTLKDIKIDQSVLCLDCDNFYTHNIINQWNGNNSVFVFKDSSKKPNYSYCIAEENMLKNIIEKEKISDLACTGAYGFNSSDVLKKWCKYIIDNNIKSKEEFYMSTVIKHMLTKNINFNIKEVLNKDYFTLGTPEKLEEYKYSLLFDLDGTLVNTDYVYIDVWNILLKDYNLNIDETFFNSFIKGQSDVSFLNFLIPSITKETIDYISLKKDKLFIEKLISSEENILIPGILEFMEKHKNKKIAIVTNCNNTSALHILKQTNLYNYVNLLIASEHTSNHKPSPYPYNYAMEKLDCDPEKTIIFEDSLSGYTSAKNSNAKKICLILNEHSSKEIIDSNDFKINNYIDLNIENICNNNLSNDDYTNIIKDKLSYLPFENITKNNCNLKTGYICDIQSYTLQYKNKDKLELIFKLSNLDNELSKTALELEMYQKESYFYQELSELINLKIPKHYGNIMHQNREGIILENLNKYEGKFNIDLNKNITVLLQIIHNIFNMHSQFYFKNEKEVIRPMKLLRKVKEIKYYKKLIEKRFDKFISKNSIFMTPQIKNIFVKIYENFEINLNKLSSFPLSFCHGDLKSPNLYYSDEIYFLDWQYIHLGKGISDIVFLLVESIEFDINIVLLIEKYYYLLMKEKNITNNYKTYLEDIKTSLSIFPFFVCVWFNSEDNDKLLDKTFPIKFMKNLIKYYEYYLK